MIEIAEAADQLRSMQAMLADSYDWLIFTSVNGVRYFSTGWIGRRDLRSLESEDLRDRPRDHGGVEALHLKVDLMPEEYVAESLVEAFAGGGTREADSAAARRRGARSGAVS